MVSYEFPLHVPLHEYFLYLVSAMKLGGGEGVGGAETQKALRTWRTQFALFEAIRS